MMPVCSGVTRLPARCSVVSSEEGERLREKVQNMISQEHEDLHAEWYRVFKEAIQRS